MHRPDNKRVLIAGANGFVGAALSKHLASKGYEVFSLSRTKRKGAIYWNVASFLLDPKDIEGFAAVICLSGETIFDYWTPDKKHQIWDSRKKSASLLADRITLLVAKPKVFICASAAGYYGSVTHDQVDESAPAGDDFLAKTCKIWESSCKKAETAGVRVVNMRLGTVFAPQGGALKEILKARRFFINAMTGAQTRYVPWISLDDLCRAFEFAIINKNLTGAVNAVTPKPTSAGQIANVVGEILKRPHALKPPDWLVKLFFGELARCVMLADQQVIPKKLLEAGFKFQHETIAAFAKSLKS